MNNTLQHHGIKGQKWGVRRFQNKDGSLTKEGKERNSENDKKSKAKELVINTALGLTVSYAGYKIASSPKVQQFMYDLMFNKGKTKMSEVTDILQDTGIFDKNGNMVTDIKILEKYGLI